MQLGDPSFFVYVQLAATNLAGGIVLANAFRSNGRKQRVRALVLMFFHAFHAFLLLHSTIAWLLQLSNVFPLL